MRTTQRLFEKVETRPVTDYYGLSAADWRALTPDQRVVHYNRYKRCEHAADLFSWPVELREEYSHDPYFNTPHLLVHSVELFFRGLCECQTCAGKFGIDKSK